MKNNKDYAHLLETYAKYIRNNDYELSCEQKDLIKKIGETFFKRPSNKSKIIQYKENAEIINRKRKKEVNLKSKSENFENVRDIGKEPGE